MSLSEFLTIDEVAASLRCDHRTVRRGIADGELEAAKIGRRWLIRPEAVDAWFDLRRVQRQRPPTPAAGPRRMVKRKSSQAAVKDEKKDERPGSVARLRTIERNSA